MASTCLKCGAVLGEEDPQLDDSCINCFADDWAEIVVESPMVSPKILHGSEAKKAGI